MTTTLWIQIYFFIVFLLFLIGYVYYTWIDPYRKWDRGDEIAKIFLWCLFWLPGYSIIVIGFTFWYFFTKTGIYTFLTKERKWLRF